MPLIDVVCTVLAKNHRDQCLLCLDLVNVLLEKGVAVVPGIAFGDDECVRLSYAISKEDIAEGLDRIEAFVKEKDISGISVGQKAYVDGTEHKVLSISDETVSAEAHFSNDMVHLERLTEQDMFYVLDLSGSLPEGAYDAAIIKEEYPPLSLLFD